MIFETIHSKDTISTCFNMHLFHKIDIFELLSVSPPLDSHRLKLIFLERVNDYDRILLDLLCFILLISPWELQYQKLSEIIALIKLIFCTAQWHTVWPKYDGTPTERNSYELMRIFSFEVSSYFGQTVWTSLVRK